MRNQLLLGQEEFHFFEALQMQTQTRIKYRKRSNNSRKKENCHKRSNKIDISIFLSFPEFCHELAL